MESSLELQDIVFYTDGYLIDNYAETVNYLLEPRVKISNTIAL